MPKGQGRTMASTELEAITGGLGSEPPAGSRAGGQWGESPLKLKAFVHFHTKEGPKDKDLNETI